LNRWHADERIDRRRRGTVADVITAGIHHVSLNIADTDRSLAFYRDTLGLASLPGRRSRSPGPGSTPATATRSI
jgi:hypothetical protein